MGVAQVKNQILRSQWWAAKIRATKCLHTLYNTTIHWRRPFCFSEACIKQMSIEKNKNKFTI